MQSVNKQREEILGEVMPVLRTMAEDWEYDDEITLDTTLFGDMGFQSLEIVVLATTVQEKFGQVLPFTELFAELGRQRRDISVGEWVEFIYQHLEN